MKFIVALIFGFSLSGVTYAQSYRNNYGFDPSLQQGNQMLQQQLQMQEQQRMHQEQMLQQQMQQQQMDQMIQQQRLNNVNMQNRFYPPRF